mgnify:CR=1 FL=1
MAPAIEMAIKNATKDINIFVESINELSNIDSYTDSIEYKGVKIFSKGIVTLLAYCLGFDYNI